MNKLLYIYYMSMLLVCFTSITIAEVRPEELIKQLNVISSFSFGRQFSFDDLLINGKQKKMLLTNEYGSISYDGKLLLLAGDIGARENLICLIDLETKSLRIVDRKNRQKRDSLIDIRGHPAADYVYWDPINPLYFYMKNSEDYVKTVFNTDGSIKSNTVVDNFSHIWRLNVKDFSEVEIVKPFNDMYSYIPSPDGKYIYMTGAGAWTESKVSEIKKHFSSLICQVQNRETLEITTINLKVSYPYYSPDGNYISYFEEMTGQYKKLVVYNLKTNKKLIPFSYDQIKWMPFNNDKEIGNPYWLPDSSGMLINVYSNTGVLKNDDGIWYINLKGEARCVATGAQVVANSPDGRYWIFSIDDKSYRMQTLKNL